MSAFTTTKNDGGVSLRTHAVVEVEVPSSMGISHREHLLEMWLAEAEKFGLLVRVVVPA